jgi:hypothetical protein
VLSASRPLRRVPKCPVGADSGDMQTLRHRPGAVLALGTLAAWTLVGCGADSSAPSEFCKSVDTLTANVEQINADYLSKSTIPAAEESLGTIDAAVKNLSDTAEAEFADDVAAVEKATKSLDKAVAAAVEKTVPANVDAARAALADLTTAVNTLAEDTSEAC